MKWVDVKISDEPPDWFLLLDEQRFAVEATTLVEIVGESGEGVSLVGVSTSLTKLVREVEADAHKDDSLHGLYAVTLSPMRNYASLRSDLFDCLLEYVRKTACLPSAREETIFKDGHRRVTIEKLQNKPDFIGEIIDPDAKWESNAKKELHHMLEAVLAKKRHLMRHVEEPIILLLLDGYRYCRESAWREVISKLNGCQWFHTICRILPPDGSNIICTQESSWRCNSRVS